MTPRAQEEYKALRATIRERGTARVWLFLVGLAVWSGLALVLLALALPPVTTLIPLVALVSTFEAVLGLHAGVERIGRYLFVFHGDGWEQAAQGFGRPPGALHPDALFVGPFIIATVVNLTPMLVASPVAAEWLVVGTAHAAFMARVLMSRAAAARQRRVDTARFEEISRSEASRA